MDIATDTLIIALFVVALFSPAVAIGFAFYYYMLYRNAPHPKRSDPVAGLLLAILVSGLVFYWLGTNLGIGVACSSASASNLCGLFGYFVLGPIASAIGIIFAAKIWSMYAIKAL